MDKRISNLLKARHVISLPELVEIVGHKTGVYRLVDKGELQKVSPDGMGYFCLPTVDEGTAYFAIVKHYYPQCVVSGPTVLSLYDLGLDYINKIDVDIPNSMNLKNDLMNVHRVVPRKITNVEERSFESKGIPFDIRVYSPERTLFEAYRYYKGLDSYFYAIRKFAEFYLDRENPGKQFNLILKINKKMGQEILNLLQMEI
ncbi:MAG: hypothetical protein R3B45_14535 [Bdellovibrionota bacterium]